MKGFGIYVKNDLLEWKHIDTMSEAIWLYLWCLDKMTSITEEGEGLLLGGQPITHELIHKELGISRATYKRWLNLLRRGGYIRTKRTPRGLVMWLQKAAKKFKNKLSTSDGSKMTHHSSQNHSDGSKSNTDGSKSNIQYKTIQGQYKREWQATQLSSIKTVDNPDIRYQLRSKFWQADVDGEIDKFKNYVKMNFLQYKDYLAAVELWLARAVAYAIKNNTARTRKKEYCLYCGRFKSFSHRCKIETNG